MENFIDIDCEDFNCKEEEISGYLHLPKRESIKITKQVIELFTMSVWDEICTHERGEIYKHLENFKRAEEHAHHREVLSIIRRKRHEQEQHA